MLGLGMIFDGGSKAVLDALSLSLGLIEFDPTGKVLTANDNFLRLVGYTLAEVQGQHHSMFVDPAYRASPEYREFWAKLARGEYDAAEYKRIGKGGREVWIKASYNPVKNASGQVVKVIKQATDVTAEKLQNAETAAKLDAVSRAQGVIEFTPTGEVITANENFLAVLGYRLEEIKGQKHRMLVEPAYGQSAEYQDFWRRLNAGDFIADEFKRIGKGGKEVWIQASYNPVFDLNGKVVKIVKFATDVTERVRAVDEIAEGLSRMAANNFEAVIPQPFAPAFEKLRQDFNAATGKVRSALLEVAGNTNNISSSAQEILNASDDMARRTEQQAANLEETAAALNQITTTIKQSAEGAQHARQICAAADEDGKASAQIVREAIEAMNNISNSAKEISQIIGMIDEIAFQTNLLALNAGVEAARAGEAGKGFAVVASEVRALAQRSAEAAKNIKGLIDVSTTQVRQGSKLVSDTGGALQRIVSQVSEINGAVAEIAGASKDQAGALAEVNTAVTQMDQVTQQNAAMVEELTAASHSLAEETSALRDLVGLFRLGRDQVAGAVARAAPAAAPRNPAPKETARAMAAPAPRRKVANGGAADDPSNWEEF